MSRTPIFLGMGWRAIFTTKIFTGYSDSMLFYQSDSLQYQIAWDLNFDLNVS